MALLPADGITYLFVSNSDNLGATLDLDLLAHFAGTDAGFLMEVHSCCPLLSVALRNWNLRAERPLGLGWGWFEGRASRVGPARAGVCVEHLGRRWALHAELSAAEPQAAGTDPHHRCPACLPACLASQVCERQSSDKKGGHLARRKADGRLM